jgi:hypothetical protein
VPSNSVTPQKAPADCSAGFQPARLEGETQVQTRAGETQVQTRAGEKPALQVANRYSPAPFVGSTPVAGAPGGSASMRAPTECFQVDQHLEW